MTNLITSLDESQAKFAIWLDERLPFLLPLFDFSERSYKPEKVSHYLSTASHGETIMARFALGVWRHDDQFDFDFIEAARVLDDENMMVITDWLSDPFWP